MVLQSDVRVDRPHQAPLADVVARNERFDVRPPVAGPRGEHRGRRVGADRPPVVLCCAVIDERE